MKNKKYLYICILLMLVFLLINSKSYAKPVVSFELSGFDSETMSEPGDVASSIQILFIITILGLAPSIIIMMTSFTRIIIVLSFLRNAIGTQQMPPNQVLIGLALFLTLFVMMPIGQEINDKALVPYTQGDINQESALNKSSDIIKGFMLRQFKNEKDLELFTRLAKIEIPVRPEELPLTVVIPAFLISELTIAFKIGFLIYIPFLIIDMVVASTLMSMGMLMLPPIMISLPFKILLFIMVDGWHMITETVIGGFT